MKKIVFFSVWMLLIFNGSLEAKTVFQFNNDVALNMVRIEIPAPIETTRAQLDGVRGKLELDLEDLTKTRGTIEADLMGITSFTFNDADKNEVQTDHMKNWFEVGTEVSPSTRAKNQWARFVIKKILSLDREASQPVSTEDEIGKKTTLDILAEGDFTLHGVTKTKTVDLDITLYEVKKEGRYEKANRVLMIRTKNPFKVSLKEHDVKPRDTKGKFISKALQVVGLKISDEAQVSLDLRAFEPKGDL